MNKVVICFAAVFSFIVSPLSHGASDIFNSFINITTVGNTWYQLGAFNGTDLGDFTSSGTLQITGAELNTFKNSGSDVTGAFLNYRIYRVGDVAPGFTEVSRGFTQNATFNDALGNSVSGAGDQKWASGALGVNALAFTGATAPGDTDTYRIEVFTRATSSDGDHFFSNFGNNFIGTFDFTADEAPPPGGAVPEPSTIGLAILGGLLFMVRKRSRRMA